MKDCVVKMKMSDNHQSLIKMREDIKLLNNKIRKIVYIKMGPEFEYSGLFYFPKDIDSIFALYRESEYDRDSGYNRREGSVGIKFSELERTEEEISDLFFRVKKRNEDRKKAEEQRERDRLDKLEERREREVLERLKKKYGE